jgi:hypothetical protein
MLTAEAWINSCQASRPGSSYELQKNSFRLVVESVRGGNPAEILTDQHSIEKIVAQLPGCALQAELVCARMGFRVYVFTDELQFTGLGKFGHEFLIGVGFISSQLVIEVNDAEDNAQLRAKFEQDSQQRNRVRATGDCNANAVSGLQEIMLADKSQH